MGNNSRSPIPYQISRSFDTASHLLQDGDLILFRRPPFPKLGWWVGKYTFSPYSHVGVLNWWEGEWHCCEFREFVGSRNLPLKSYLEEKNYTVDLYRASPVCYIPIVEDEGVREKAIHLYKWRLQCIVESARSLVGRGYGWRNIIKMMTAFTPFIRLWSNRYHNGTEPEVFVCSTLATYVYRKCYSDPNPFLSDDHVSPADLARSSLFRYICTIC